MLFTIKSRARLDNGVEIPRLGLGVYQSPPGRITQHAVKYALNLGYRHIDTASLYGNEPDVGMALREGGLRREEVFITTKVWNSDQLTAHNQIPTRNLPTRRHSQQQGKAIEIRNSFI